MEKIIRELGLRLITIISEQNEDLAAVLLDSAYEDIIEESIEMLTDESLKILDDYIESIDSNDE